MSKKHFIAHYCKKGYVLGACLLASLLFSSCDVHKDCREFKYILENQSGVDLVLKQYHLRIDGKISQIEYVSLQNGNQWSKREKDCGSHSMYNYSLFFGRNGVGPNVVEVIYGGKKKKVMELQRFTNTYENTCVNDFGEPVPCDLRNMLNVSHYNQLDEHFVFTADDYDQAEDCQGDCE